MRKIIRKKDGEWSGLGYYNPRFPPEDELPLGEPTAAEYAALCDEEAVNCNYHSLSGTHLSLFKLLSDHVSEAQATQIMKEIAEAGGLWRI